MPRSLKLDVESPLVKAVLTSGTRKQVWPDWRLLNAIVALDRSNNLRGATIESLNRVLGPRRHGEHHVPAHRKCYEINREFGCAYLLLLPCESLPWERSRAPFPTAQDETFWNADRREQRQHANDPQLLRPRPRFCRLPFLQRRSLLPVAWTPAPARLRPGRSGECSHPSGCMLLSCCVVMCC